MKIIISRMCSGRRQGGSRVRLRHDVARKLGGDGRDAQVHLQDGRGLRGEVRVFPSQALTHGLGYSTLLPFLGFQLKCFTFNSRFAAKLLLELSRNNSSTLFYLITCRFAHLYFSGD